MAFRTILVWHFGQAVQFFLWNVCMCIYIYTTYICVCVCVCMFHHHQLALQPGVGLGLRYNMPPGLSVPCSVSPFVYTHLSQVHGNVISHLILGLPLRLVAYSFPYSIFFGIAVSCILSICPSHLILWHLINLTTFSPLIMASNSSFRRILHNSFSFTGMCLCVCIYICIYTYIHKYIYIDTYIQ